LRCLYFCTVRCNNYFLHRVLFIINCNITKCKHTPALFLGPHLAKEQYKKTGNVFILFLSLALQPIVGFGLSKNSLPFFPNCHHLSPSSIYQPTNAHIISHKTLLKHFKTLLKHSDMFRFCPIIIRELCSLLQLYYSSHNSIRICKRGVVEQWLGVRRTTHT